MKTKKLKAENEALKKEVQELKNTLVIAFARMVHPFAAPGRCETCKYYDNETRQCWSTYRVGAVSIVNIDKPDKFGCNHYKQKEDE